MKYLIFFLILLISSCSTDSDHNSSNLILQSILKNEDQYFTLWLRNTIKENNNYDRSYNWPLVSSLEEILDYERSEIEPIKNSLLNVQIDQTIDTSKLVDKLNYRDSLLWFGYYHALQESHEYYGYSLKEVEELVSKGYESYKDLLSYENVELSSNSPSMKEEFQVEILGVSKVREGFFRNIYMQILGRSNIDEDYFFPVVLPSRTCYNFGEVFEAQMSIGSYSTTLNPKNVLIIVNNDSLHLDGNGKAFYKEIIDFTGEKKLNIKCFINDPYSGGTYESASSFIYQVNH